MIYIYNIYIYKKKDKKDNLFSYIISAHTD